MADVPLRDYLDTQIGLIRQLIEERFAASDRHLDRRLEDMNEKSKQRHDSQKAAADTARDMAAEALREAKDAAEKGFQRTNEWKTLLTTVMDRKADKEEFAARLEAIGSKVDVQIQSLDTRALLNSDRIGKMEGSFEGSSGRRDSAISIIAIFIAAIGSVLNGGMLLILHFMK